MCFSHPGPSCPLVSPQASVTVHVLSHFHIHPNLSPWDLLLDLAMDICPLWTPAPSTDTSPSHRHLSCHHICPPHRYLPLCEHVSPYGHLLPRRHLSPMDTCPLMTPALPTDICPPANTSAPTAASSMVVILAGLPQHSANWDSMGPRGQAQMDHRPPHHGAAFRAPSASDAKAVPDTRLASPLQMGQHPVLCALQCRHRVSLPPVTMRRHTSQMWAVLTQTLLNVISQRQAVRARG